MAINPLSWARDTFCSATGFCAAPSTAAASPGEKQDSEITQAVVSLVAGGATTVLAYFLLRSEMKSPERFREARARRQATFPEVKPGSSLEKLLQQSPEARVSRAVHRVLVEGGDNATIFMAGRPRQSDTELMLERVAKIADFLLRNTDLVQGADSEDALARDLEFRRLVIWAERESGFESMFRGPLQDPYTSMVVLSLADADVDLARDGVMAAGSDPVIAALPAVGQPLDPAVERDPADRAVGSGLAAFAERIAAATPEESAANGAARSLEGSGATVPDVRGTGAASAPRIPSAIEGATPRGLPGASVKRLK